MNSQAIRFRLGIFVLAVMILLAVLITLFGGFPNYFRQMDGYTILFNNAQGVSPGTPVRRSGVRIGKVKGIQLDNETGKVNVDIEIEEKFRLRKADRPTLERGLLSGDTAIAFLPPEDLKGADLSPVPPGSTLEGFTGTDPAFLIQKTADLVPPAEEALLEIRNAFRKLDKMSPLMEETLKEYRDLAKATNALVPELGKTNKEVQELVRTTREVMPELRKTNVEIQELVRVTRGAVPDLKRTNEEFQLLARTWSKMGERLDLLVQTNEERLTKSVARLEETLKRTSELLSDENLRNLREILRNAKIGSDSLENLAKGSEVLIRDSQLAVKRLNENLLKADKVLDNIDRASRPFAERSDPILKNMEESTDKLNRTLGDLRETFRILARSDGTLQKLLSDPALYQNLNDTAIMVQKLLPRVDRILNDVEIFSDKIARHPESLGIGGVIRPSIGLKESPTILPWKLGGHP